MDEPWLTKFVPDPENPWYTRGLVTAVAAVNSHAAYDAGAGSPLATVLVITAALLGAEGWIRFHRGAQPTAPMVDSVGLATSVGGASSRGRKNGRKFFVIGLIVSLGAAAIGQRDAWSWILAVLPFGLAGLRIAIGDRESSIDYGLVPVLWGLTCASTAALAGNVAAGIFPAVFATLFSLILRITSRAEKLARLRPEPADVSGHVLSRRGMSWISLLFFIFGVVSLWPWLGKMYGNTYFWILVMGVLLPVMFLWGRLRQPRHEDPLVSLFRFNRLVPYAALPLLVAVALG